MLRYWEDLLKKHEYWDEKPTLREDKDQKPGNIEGERKVADVSKEPLALPREGLYWSDIDLKNDGELDEVKNIQFSSTIS